MGIWRSWLAWAPLDSPAASRLDTPGKRAEGPGSPKGGKMEEEWPENEGWTFGQPRMSELVRVSGWIPPYRSY